MVRSSVAAPNTGVASHLWRTIKTPNGTPMIIARPTASATSQMLKGKAGEIACVIQHIMYRIHSRSLQQTFVLQKLMGYLLRRAMLDIDLSV